MSIWTEEQKKTIDTVDHNILVSAAAGSGKTTVLIERIKKLIIEEQTDVDRFLITTYTRAASAEMRQRLETAIRGELVKKAEEGDDKGKAFLLRQLQLLPGAAIGTFHSFALEIIRQYFYLTDLEPGFTTMDDAQETILQNDVVNQLFEEKYEEASDEFFAFLRKHSGHKSDYGLKNDVLKIYKNLRSIPHYMDWAKERTELMRGDNPVEDMGLKAFIAEECRRALPQALAYFEKAGELLNTPNTAKLYAKHAEDTEWIRQGIGCEDDFEKMHTVFTRTFNRMQATKTEQEAYDLIKPEVSALRDAGKAFIADAKKCFFLRTLDEYNEELQSVADDTAYMLRLVEDFENAYRDAKAEENVIDMDDVMHYAIGILEDERAAAEQRDRFQYIFVDEYQDSNMLQETIVLSIARKDNLFMVGDVKQSIYKFRLAEPELFISKAKAYDSDDEPNSMVIDLNKNYRSKQNVTEAVNAVFEAVMPGYDERAQLHCMAPDEHPGYETTLHIINREDFGDDDPGREEAEADLVASIIRDAHGSEVFDTKKGIIRKVEYKDIAVLARAGKTVADVERYLNNKGIPAYGDTGEGYYETVEIQVFLNLLRVVDNMRQDVPLISVMRSAIFGFDVRELSKIRINQRDGSFCSAVRAYRESGPDEDLRGKIQEMEERIGFWKELGKAVPLEELVRTLLYDTGYYDYCSGLPVGGQRTSNLQLIVEKAAQFEKSNHSGLSGFLRYVEAMADSNTSEAEAKTISENEDVVHVMTVHKSKGLEFPVVILTGVGKEIRTSGGKNAAPMHKNFGLGLPLVNREEHWQKKTLLQNVISECQKTENMDEAIRILYVAMTRAKDRLELVGSIKSDEVLNDVPGTKSYLDMMYASIKDLPGTIVQFHSKTDGEEEETETYGKKAADLLALMNGTAADPEDALYQEIDRRLGYAYEAASTEPVKLKYSVTELNSDGHHYEVPIAEFEPDMTKHRLTAAEAGTVMHLIMEKLDFAKAKDEGEAYIESVADAFAASGKITPEERHAVRADKIAGFFATEIGRRAAKAYEAGGLMREKEFILEKELGDTAGGEVAGGGTNHVGGTKAVVQGVIDCFFEEDGEIVLIDYKNSYMGGGRMIEDIRDTYADQIAIYREALEGATGKRVKESYLFLFDLGQFVEM